MTIVDNKKVAGRFFTFARGVHPPHRKQYSASQAVRRVAPPVGGTVVVPMIQHIGGPCAPVVEKKQAVTAGQVVGEAEAFVSAPVHSPVNGVVADVAPMPHPLGRKVLAAVITVGEEQPPAQQWQDFTGEMDPSQHSPEAIGDAIRAAGIVGHGGAAFPTAVKLKANPERPVDTVLVNGCECEPYLTSDHRLMIEAPGSIVAGLRLAMRACGAEKGLVAIEDNKPDAINSMLAAIREAPGVQLAICRTKYPQGGERQLISAVLDRVVPTGGLPLEVGVVVANVGTLAAVAWAVAEGRPVTERIVTVTGAGVKEPGNFRVPVGMLLSDLLAAAGGLTDDAAQVLLGGPMMGPATARLDIPIVKGTSGITVMTAKEVATIEATACIRCARCVDVCPLRLTPTRIAHAAKARDIDMALEYDLQACIECGCCTYVCPAQIPLVQYLRAGKQLARQAHRK